MKPNNGTLMNITAEAVKQLTTTEASDAILESAQREIDSKGILLT